MSTRSLLENVQRYAAAKTAIANAITSAGGTVNPGDGFEDFATAIGTIPSGGGSSSNDVNFYDYDGTIVQSYSADDFANLSELPANPTHEGLTAQGWNWSLADAKTHVASYGNLNIGQMYTTSDGKTRIYISLPEGRTSPILQLYLNDNSELDIDWGDGSTHSTFTSTSADYKSERHEYSTSGNYVIAITVVSGGFVLQSSSTSISSILWDGNDNTRSPDRAYSNAIKKIEIGDSVTRINDYAFGYCSSLSSITIPDGVTGIGTNAFKYCYSLSSITIPDSVTSIDSKAFYYCSSLSSIAIPKVTSIGNTAFQNCSSLSSITIPVGVTSIGSAFQYCSYMSYIKFKSTTPPTVSSSNAWSGVSTSTKILVPRGTLNTYKTATNYPDPSTYTYEEY